MEEMEQVTQAEFARRVNAPRSNINRAIKTGMLKLRNGMLDFDAAKKAWDGGRNVTQSRKQQKKVDNKKLIHLIIECEMRDGTTPPWDFNCEWLIVGGVLTIVADLNAEPSCISYKVEPVPL